MSYPAIKNVDPLKNEATLQHVYMLLEIICNRLEFVDQLAVITNSNINLSRQLSTKIDNLENDIANELLARHNANLNEIASLKGKIKKLQADKKNSKPQIAKKFKEAP